MKLIPTFCDGNFHGFETLKEINRLKSEAYELAMSKQEDEKADHMIYGYFDYDEVINYRHSLDLAGHFSELDDVVLLEGIDHNGYFSLTEVLDGITDFLNECEN